MSETKAQRMANQFGGNMANIVRAPGVGQGGAPPAAREMTEEDRKREGMTRLTGFQNLQLDLIHRDPNQPREEFDAEDITTLAASLKKHGQLAPIRVRWLDGRWVVISGERRWRAAQEAGLPSIQVKVIDGELDPGDVLEEQVVENIARSAFKPAEECRAFKRLMDMRGWSPEQLAANLCISTSAVYRSLQLSRLDDDVAARVDSGEMTPAVAREVAKLDTAEEQRAVAEAVVAHDLDAKTVAEVVNKAKADKKKAEGKGGGGAKSVSRPKSGPKLPTIVQMKVGAASIVVQFRKNVPDREVLEALEGAAERIRAKVEGAEAIEAATRPMLALTGPDEAEDAA